MCLIKIALADDHPLIHKAIGSLLIPQNGFYIKYATLNGKELTEKLHATAEEHLPDIALIDINMPVMDGYETIAYLKQHFPTVKTVCLTIYNSTVTIDKVMQCGAKAFINKNSDPETIKEILYEVHHQTERGRSGKDRRDHPGTHLSEKETEFLKYCCRDLNYVQIAEQMHKSVNTIYTYRDVLYQKLDVKNRSGLILYALRAGLVFPEEIE